MNNKSNLDNKESGMLMFLFGGKFLLYSPYKGLAAANTEHLAFKEWWVPALAIVMVYYSMASWMATLSNSFILSNSSIQITPPSAKTMAPASKFLSLVVLSTEIEAVKPTPEEPLPVVLIANGAVDNTYLKN